MSFKKGCWCALFIGLPITTWADVFNAQLVNAALERTEHTVIYNGKYVAIDYPNGDVPAYMGVCTDVVIRTYRALNIDLQRLVHEDMRTDFEQYPSKRVHNIGFGPKLNDMLFDYVITGHYRYAPKSVIHVK